MSKTPITLVGATGLTGSQTLLSLLLSKTPFEITTLTRKPLPSPKASESTFINKVYADLNEAKDGGNISSPGGIYVSCLGTTRAVAGGVENQEKIDLVLNRDLARKAKDDGASMMILVSTHLASASSRNAYTRMKGQLEDDVKAMNFDRTIILQPGLLLGARTESRPAEAIARSIFGGLRSFGVPVTAFAVDSADVGACIAQLSANPPEKGVITLNSHDIVNYAQAFRAN